jgi:hypothetical protein
MWCTYYVITEFRNYRDKIFFKNASSYFYDDDISMLKELNKSCMVQEILLL